MAIKTCFFDMGNVLVHFSHEKMCENMASLTGLETGKIAETLLGSGLQWQLERGQISEEEFHSSFERALGLTVSFEDLKLAAADIFWLNDSIVPLIGELKALGVRLVLLSNTSITHMRFIQERYEFLNLFDALTTSFQVGALKPDTAIYEDALLKANCKPEECFYTDDIEEYVLKARTFGIKAEVYTETESTRLALASLGVALGS